MQPNSTLSTINTILQAPLILLTLISVIIGILAASVSIIVGLITIFKKMMQFWRISHSRRTLRKRQGAEIYTPDEFRNNMKYYIRPNCQDVDPTQEEEIRGVLGVKQDLFKTIDERLDEPGKYKYIIVLADSGMGKTAFVMNYYVRHWRNRRRRRKFNLALVPLGMKNADQLIKQVPDAHNTVLFLDALDEDTQAIQNHKQRIAQILELSEQRNFRQVLITCRTQFFRQEEEIPKETGIIKFSTVDAGESREFLFYKLYLSPFSDQQVEKYLHRRFPFWKRKLRQKACKMARDIKHLTARPMLLVHIQDLVQTQKALNYSFQLYEEMVEAWLEREKPYVKNKEALREFSECLAIDLFLNRQERGAERVHYSELKSLAEQYKIPLKEWQLRGRSLLNRNTDGYYKFAHRSIMEYLFVKRFLATEAHSTPKIEWTDQMLRFLEEMILFWIQTNSKIPNLTNVNFGKSTLERIFLSMKSIYSLRTKPKKMGDEDVVKIIKYYNFFDNRKNTNGTGIHHNYLLIELPEKIIMDISTGLLWQQSGSSDYMTYENAQKYIDELNQNRFAGFDDWRLPTLEEAMSLMESKQNQAGLYIDPRFDSKQRWIWTADQVKGESWAWYVDFGDGRCYSDQCIRRPLRSSVAFRTIIGW